jgi:hypothetical protein
MEQLEDETEDSEESIQPPVKVILFKNGTYVVSQIVEVLADYGMPNCKLIEPYKIIKTQGTSEPHFEKFPLYVDQDEIMMSSDSFLTISDASDSIEDMYRKKITE